MSTSNSSASTIEDALVAIPAQFRSKLIKHFTALKRSFVRGDFDSCGTRAGRFSETLVRYVQHSLAGTFTPFGQQLDLYVEARKLEQLPKSAGPEPFRIFIPRALCFLYTLRNKRGFAHVGGDIDSDPVDAATCVAVADWCLCELIRVVHTLSLEEAQELTNALATRDLPKVWSVSGRKRILRPDLSYRLQVLLLLYSETETAILVEDLYDWTEYSTMAKFQSRILQSLHDERLIEWERDSNTAIISPTGIAVVEAEVLSPEGTTDK